MREFLLLINKKMNKKYLIVGLAGIVLLAGFLFFNNIVLATEINGGATTSGFFSKLLNPFSSSSFPFNSTGVTGTSSPHTLIGIVSDINIFNHTFTLTTNNGETYTISSADILKKQADREARLKETLARHSGRGMAEPLPKSKFNLLSASDTPKINTSLMEKRKDKGLELKEGTKVMVNTIGEITDPTIIARNIRLIPERVRVSSTLATTTATTTTVN